MTSITISQASELIWELLETLEDAYWEASTCDGKDQIFNLMRLLTNEYTELLKVSVQDHHYEYEVITIGLRELRHTLEEFQSVCTSLTRRQQTAERLMAVLKRFNHHLHH